MISSLINKIKKVFNKKRKENYDELSKDIDDILNSNKED